MSLEFSKLLIQCYTVMLTSFISMDCFFFLILNNAYLYLHIFIIKLEYDFSVILCIYFQVKQRFWMINSSLIFIFRILFLYSCILFKNSCLFLFLVIKNYKTMKFSEVSFAHVQKNVNTLCSWYSCFKVVSNNNIYFIVGTRCRCFTLNSAKSFPNLMLCYQ